MTTGKHTLLVKVLAVTSSVSVDQIVGVCSWMASAFCNAVYNRKVPMYCPALQGKMQFFTYLLQSLEGKKYYVIQY